VSAIGSRRLEAGRCLWPEAATGFRPWPPFDRERPRASKADVRPPDPLGYGGEGIRTLARHTPSFNRRRRPELFTIAAVWSSDALEWARRIGLPGLTFLASHWEG
jgi:hypothetical protein